MPLICIKSLPFEDEIDVPAMIRSVTEDFARGAEISIEHITVTWEFIPARQYAVAGLMPASQPSSDSHPVLIELHAPSFHDAASIKAMMESVAFSVSKRSGVAYSNIFISYRKVFSGDLFDRGEVVHWK